MFNIGEVIRVEYKWPRDKDLNDGVKERGATVIKQYIVDGELRGVFVSPHTGQEPRGEEAKYAIKLDRKTQRQTGLLKTDRNGVPLPNQKESWILANHSNLIMLPDNPALRPTEDRQGKRGWVSGTVPNGVLVALKERRTAATEAKEMHTDFIRNEKPALARSLPGPGRSSTARDAKIINATKIIAAKRAAERAQSEPRKYLGEARG